MGHQRRQHHRTGHRVFRRRGAEPQRRRHPRGGRRPDGEPLLLSPQPGRHHERGEPASDIVVEHSEFAYQQIVGRFSHNLYIGTARSFTLRFSYFHHAGGGRDAKSRAHRNEILYNRIVDELEGRSSYAIESPDGGLSYVIGNVLQQGPLTENDAIVAYGAEGLKNPINELYVVNNTLVNDLPNGGRFIFAREGRVWAMNNVWAGPGEELYGGATAELRNNLQVKPSDFVAPAEFDYRLRPGSVAIGRGIDPGQARGFDLRPIAKYVHKVQGRSRARMEQLDLGAFPSEPIRFLQTNLSETDSTVDPAALVAAVARLRRQHLPDEHGRHRRAVSDARAVPLPERVPAARPRSVRRRRCARRTRGKIRVVGRFDLSKTQKPVFDAHPEWFFRRANGEPAIYNGLYSTCINGDYYREHALTILAEALERYEVDGLFFNMFGNPTADYSGVRDGAVPLRRLPGALSRPLRPRRAGRRPTPTIARSWPTRRARSPRRSPTLIHAQAAAAPRSSPTSRTTPTASCPSRTPPSAGRCRCGRTRPATTSAARSAPSRTRWRSTCR